ncbi:ComEC/Rec2 family competence protein, partial [Candidatus Microgenomates bacterium]|nr:ComEC/Rec2 family competence protein [Candidatus Microgenomates bacterium]
MKKYLIWLFLITLIVVRFLVLQTKFKDGDRVRITGQVLNEPQRFDTSQYIKIANLKTYLPQYPEVYYGDKIVIEGVVEKTKLKQAKLISIQSSNNFLFKIRNKLVFFYKSNLPEPHASLVAGSVIGSKQGIPKEFMDNLVKTGTSHVVVASGMNVSLVGGFLIMLLTGIL